MPKGDAVEGVPEGNALSKFGFEMLDANAPQKRVDATKRKGVPKGDAVEGVPEGDALSKFGFKMLDTGVGAKRKIINKLLSKQTRQKSERQALEQLNVETRSKKLLENARSCVQRVV